MCDKRSVFRGKNNNYYRIGNKIEATKTHLFTSKHKRWRIYNNLFRSLQSLNSAEFSSSSFEKKLKKGKRNYAPNENNFFISHDLFRCTALKWKYTSGIRRTPVYGEIARGLFHFLLHLLSPLNKLHTTTIEKKKTHVLLTEFERIIEKPNGYNYFLATGKEERWPKIRRTCTLRELCVCAMRMHTTEIPEKPE